MESQQKRVTKVSSLRRSFILTVAVTFSMVILLSALVIWGCAAFRHWLLPDADAVYLTVEETFSDGTTNTSTQLMRFDDIPQTMAEFIAGSSAEDNEKVIEIGEIPETKYSIEKIENTFDALSPKRKAAYQICGVSMVAFPALFSITGILLCGFFFYRKKLDPPFRLLMDATEKIAAQNLDFSLQYDTNDEMGALCDSFEQMRQALAENNRSMWALLEQRRLMQASIAHDLRNPIAIIEGYTEYLQLNLPQGKLDDEKVLQIADRLHMTAKRLDRYTESVRELNLLEELEPSRGQISSQVLAAELGDDLALMAGQAGLTLSVEDHLPETSLSIDTAVFYRIMENVLANALRFAKSQIQVELSLADDQLTVMVIDDGDGFSDGILEKKAGLFFPAEQEEGHLGMGLTVSKILCEKHGGSLRFFNADDGVHGAVVKIVITV